jgi:hypothetical protein
MTRAGFQRVTRGAPFFALGRGFFTQTRWRVACAAHRASLTGSLMNRERSA